MSRTRSVLAVSTLGIAGLLASVLGAAPAGAAHPAKAPTATKYGLEASGSASIVKGGQVPAASEKAAYAVVACTNLAGLSNANTEVDGDLGNGLTFEGASTRAWTAEVGGKVSSWSRQRIAEVTLLGTPLGDLTLRALTSTTHTWHDSTGFHGTTTSSLGQIMIHPAVGDDQIIPVPSPGQVVTIPGVAEIRLGSGHVKTTGSAAAGAVDAVKLTVLETDTVALLAHTRAAIYGGVAGHLYGGSAYATKATLLDDILASGKTVPTVVPCVGTDGEWTGNDAANVDLAENMVATALHSRQQSGLAPSGRPAVTTMSRVGLVNLGNGLVINLVRARAHIEKSTTGYRRDADGTTVGSVVLNGEEQTFPDTGVLEIPGIAKLERTIVDRDKRSISVIALRVTLLDGTGAIVDLGNATARLRPSGL